MKEQMLIGETLFEMETPLPVCWKPEEKQFFYQGEEYRRRVRIRVEFVSQLPNLMKTKRYETEGLKVGADRNGNEVRTYRALYEKGQPQYAVSVAEKAAVTVYFRNEHSLWNNPNMRIWNLIHMEHFLLGAGALVLHCSYLMYQGKAILFSAPSGTGKTTQAKLWEKNCGARIINGDKAVIQKKEGVWYACGYPFHGSAEECLNLSYPIRAVALVRQSPADFIEQLSPLQKLQAIYSETTVNAWDKETVGEVLDRITDLAEHVTVVCQHCTMREEACRTLQCCLNQEEAKRCSCTI